MKKETEINLLEHTVTLFGEHLAQAIEEYKLATRSQHKGASIVFRHSISSIIHGVCSLDSLANYLGSEMFFNEKSENHIASEKRSVALQKLLKDWNFRLQILDKFDLILAELKSEPLKQALKEKVEELNTLRNRLVHGKSYTITYLEEVIYAGMRFESTIYDSEVNFDKDKKKKKFSKTGFQRPGALNDNDARIALLIVFGVITEILSKIKWFHTNIVTYCDGEKSHWLGFDSTVEKLIEEFDL